MSGFDVAGGSEHPVGVPSQFAPESIFTDNHAVVFPTGGSQSENVHDSSTTQHTDSTRPPQTLAPIATGSSAASVSYLAIPSSTAQTPDKGVTEAPGSRTPQKSSTAQSKWSEFLAAARPPMWGQGSAAADRPNGSFDPGSFGTETSSSSPAVVPLGFNTPEVPTPPKSPGVPDTALAKPPETVTQSPRKDALLNDAPEAVSTKNRGWNELPSVANDTDDSLATFSPAAGATGTADDMSPLHSARGLAGFFAAVDAAKKSAGSISGSGSD